MSTSLKTDTSYSVMMDVSGPSQREEDTCLKHGYGQHLELLIWDNTLFYGCVCIVHVNNSTSLTCIVCNCTLITLANSM